MIYVNRPKSQPITILSGVQGDTRRYRNFHLAEQLRLSQMNCSTFHISDPQAAKCIYLAKILILQRVTYDRILERIIRAKRSQDAILLADLDDLVYLQDSFRWIDSPDFVDSVRARLYQENLDRNRQTLQQCEGIIVSTGFLAQKVSELGKPVWVHRNAFSLEMFACAIQALSNQVTHDAQIILGYASGTPTHDRDFQLVQPILKQVLEDYPAVHLHLIGHISKKIDWGRVSSKVHYLDFVPWRKLPLLLAQFSINLAPLRLDNPFSQSKSEIKYIEAALVKVPTIASPTEAFQHAIRHGENGYLADSIQEWEKNLRALIENPSLRRTTGETAYQDVLARYAPWVRAEEAIQLLNSILQTLRPHWQALPQRHLNPISNPANYRRLWVSSQIEKHPTLLERGLYTLRARGIVTLLKEIWIFLRRTAVPLFPFR